jgi:uncharacterized lipoprotein YmbA
MLLKSVSIALLLLVAACSGQPVDTNYYLLRGDHLPESRSLSASGDFALGTVVVATYIDQPGIAFETGGGQIRPALHHQWAEPMHQSLRSYLQREISTLLGEDLFPVGMSSADTVLDIRVDQLHGTHDGEAVLFAYWWLRKGDEIIEPHQFGKTLALNSDGYAALVAAEKALLNSLAREIADKLKDLR